jgi:Lar family restriction alleviation protein
MTRNGDPMPGLDLDVLYEKILPCPFCGCSDTEEVMNDGARSLECLHCHATGPYVDPVLEDVIEAWNSRDPDNTYKTWEEGS